MKKGDIRDQACAWIARLKKDSVSQSEREDFAAWLTASGAHREAFDEMLTLWQELDVLKFKVDDLPQQDKQLEQPSPISAERPGPQTARQSEREYPPEKTDQQDNAVRRGPGRRTFIAALALPMFAAFMALFMLQSQPDDRSGTEGVRIATAVGEQRLVELPDGTEIHLNTDSRIRYIFTANTRLIVLERGEVFFQVARDTSRPFQVRLPSGVVEAIGTAFNIRLHDDAAEVVVTEGKVGVYAHGDKQPRVWAEENQQVDMPNSGSFQRRQLGSTGHSTEWMAQKVSFSDRPLHEVVAEINRYTDFNIKISDSAVAALRVTGVFQLDAPLAVLKAIITSLNLQQTVKDRLILIHQA